MSIPRDNYIGEPGYPAPWTTKQPLEGLRDVDEARIVSLSPDVCLTPVGSSVVPIPYPVVDYCGHDRNYTPSVRFTGQKAMVMRSCTTHVHGDAPGTRKGVKSGTVESICEPIGHAAQVRAEGSNVIRHLDRFWMNNKNTQGEALFVKGTQTYSPPQNDDPVQGSLRWIPGSDDGRVVSDAMPEPLIMGAKYAFNGSPATYGGQVQSAPQPQVPTPQAPRGAPGNVIQGPWQPKAPPILEQPTTPTDLAGRLARLGRFAAIGLILLIPGDTPIIPPLPYNADPVEKDLNGRATDLLDPLDSKYNQEVRKWYFEQLNEYRDYKKKQAEQQQPQAIPSADNVRVKERDEYRKKCQVDRYGKMKDICGQYGMQAHHIVPDWTLRYGARSDSNKRIPNMPSLNDGMAICVIGNAAMQDTEHHEAHLGDSNIENMGKASAPPGTAPLSQVVKNSMETMIAARPDCAKEITEAMVRQFGAKKGNQILRAVKDIGKNPLNTDTIEALKSGATYPWKKGGQ